jgi:hypothetical protein
MEPFVKGKIMPMSKEATEGLRAAVEYNPAAARYFMNIIRFLPIGVRYKEQDRYGPLAMMIPTFTQTMQITDKVSIPVKNARPFPQEKLKFCEIFNKEWLERRFTKQELADTIEQMLSEIQPRPLLEKVNDSTTLVFTAEGTFLSDDLYEREMKRKIDPEQQ